ncbi:Transposable element Tcb1 transposase [Cucumispora dikerogammari]|nr:Transposable element Tcb1 transposase [Cucumispora dikerogammari]
MQGVSFQNNEYFNNVIFSDETKFNFKNSDGQTFVWKKPSERLEEKNIKKTVKFGGESVMFWGCFSKYGVGKLKVIDGIMDKYGYVDILRSNLEASAEKFGLNAYKFQQDNDPKHTSGYAREYMSKIILMCLFGRPRVRI